MPVNTDTWSPTAHPSLAYDADLKPTLRGVLVLAPGTLVAKDVTGVEVKITFAALDPSGTDAAPHCEFPKRVDLQLSRIVGDGSGMAGNGDAGTDLALTDIIGLV